MWRRRQNIPRWVGDWEEQWWGRKQSLLGRRLESKNWHVVHVLRGRCPSRDTAGSGVHRRGGQEGGPKKRKPRRELWRSQMETLSDLMQVRSSLRLPETETDPSLKPFSSTQEMRAVVNWVSPEKTFSASPPFPRWIVGQPRLPQL